MIVYLEGFYQLDKIYRSYKYKPSKYRDLLFRQRPDLKELFLYNTTAASNHKKVIAASVDIPLKIEGPVYNDLNLIISSCRSINIPDEFTYSCLESLKNYKNISDTVIFDIISKIYEGTNSTLLDIQFPKQYLNTCILSELRERKLIP